MAYTATHKYARISPRKVRALADLVRGKFADEALDILRFQPHRGARMLEKVIKSALGNAEHQQASGIDDLVVLPGPAEGFCLLEAARGQGMQVSEHLKRRTLPGIDLAGHRCGHRQRRGHRTTER